MDIRILDMAAQRHGVEVLAAAAGRVARVRDGVADISIRAEGAPSVKGQECGNAVVIDHGGGWETQYCHLARGSLKVKPGDQVAAGQPLARVGLSGATEFPHLHLSVRHGTEAIDPFAPAAAAACTSQTSLWTASAGAALTYKTGAVLNTGFSSAPVTMQAIEDGRITQPNRQSDAMIAYVRAIGLQRGDEVELTVTAPNGETFVTRREPALPTDKAQQFLFVGKKRPAGGWVRGTYRATYRVHRGGRVILPQRFEIAL